MEQEVEKVYGNKVRVRACGLVLQDDRILMVNHRGITPTNFWSPPGGGVDFGRSIGETLQKEFAEETGLQIEPRGFLFGCEFIDEPIHSIELFYDVAVTGGELRKGKDPEIQIITDVRYLDFSTIKRLPVHEVHGIFRFTQSIGDISSLNGFYRI